MLQAAIVKKVRAVRVVDSLRRKPETLRLVSFYGEYDVWRYEPKWDTKLCEECMSYSLKEYFWGKHLRELFEYHKILDANTIQVLVHPNCRCELHRVTDVLEYLEFTQGLFKP